MVQISCIPIYFSATPYTLGVKKIPVVSYREKIRVGRSEIIFF
jgi:hypothetical protein